MRCVVLRLRHGSLRQYNFNDQREIMIILLLLILLLLARDGVRINRHNKLNQSNQISTVLLPLTALRPSDHTIQERHYTEPSRTRCIGSACYDISILNSAPCSAVSASGYGQDLFFSGRRRVRQEVDHDDGVQLRELQIGPSGVLTGAGGTVGKLWLAKHHLYLVELSIVGQKALA